MSYRPSVCPVTYWTDISMMLVAAGIVRLYDLKIRVDLLRMAPVGRTVEGVIYPRLYKLEHCRNLLISSRAAADGTTPKKRVSSPPQKVKPV
ncbi:hypothetical protein EVAR_3128_1 [Eumeta japonica]|uniref:Uncharacterized protein n=1 Tax=Eumeta variegata TaxID=151549 RepID=A0A4C1XEW2_EUMVA|nr:hypothetical protein EVAR_3128_1 [Eumeta japonica]